MTADDVEARAKWKYRSIIEKLARMFVSSMRKAGRRDLRALYRKYKAKYEELTGDDAHREFSKYKTMSINTVYRNCPTTSI